MTLPASPPAGQNPPPTPDEAAIVARFCRERAAGYGSFRRCAPSAVALDRAADLLDALCPPGAGA